jgi:hypothetical protein
MAAQQAQAENAKVEELRQKYYGELYTIRNRAGRPHRSDFVFKVMETTPVPTGTLTPQHRDMLQAHLSFPLAWDEQGVPGMLRGYMEHTNFNFNERMVAYDYVIDLIEKAVKLSKTPKAVANQLKVQRLMSEKHADVESALRPYFTESREPLGVQKSKALTLVGKPGVPDFSPRDPPPPPPGGAGPAAAGAGGPAGGRRKTTRSPSRLSRRRRSKRSRRNRGNARSL